MRGQAEMQAQQLDTLGKRQGDLYADLDQRVAELAKAAPAADAAQPVVPAAAAPSPESASYEAALALFREDKFPAAIAGFQAFLKAYPQSELAANAQYWIGYSHYALKDYKTALAHPPKLVAA